MNLNQIIKANKADYKLMMSAACTAVDYAINIGERLIEAQAKVDHFGDWLDDTHPFKRRQANKYIRVAVHKAQTRFILQDHGELSINDLQTLLPKASEEPVLSEADLNKMAYVGSKPGEARNADDWHTPSVFTDAARKVMGSIDLDPFTSVQANKHIKADLIMTEADDAFSREWALTDNQTVWMNPPYSRGASSKAVERFLEQYDNGAFAQAVVLMNASTDTNWFHQMINVASAFCLTKGRISFEDAGGKKSSGNTKGQVFFYFGNKAKTFKKTFSEYGYVVLTENI